jgi:hypothetical protein
MPELAMGILKTLLFRRDRGRNACGIPREGIHLIMFDRMMKYV